MQYIYYGLIPLLMAGWMVYRGWYSKKSEPMAAQLLGLIFFAITYGFILGFVPALLSTLLVIIITLVWGHAIRREEEKKRLGK